MTDTDIEAQINAMYALHNRIEAALIATYGPIEKWDEDYGIGLSDGQYKSLAATMAEWFMDWIKDEGMVRTPGTVQITKQDAAAIICVNGSPLAYPERHGQYGIAINNVCGALVAVTTKEERVALFDATEDPA